MFLQFNEFLKELDLAAGRSTGIPKILRVMAENGSPAPEFESDADRASFLIRLPVHAKASRQMAEKVTPEVTPEVTTEVRLIRVLVGEMSRRQIQEALKLKNKKYFRESYLQPALKKGLIEMTDPDKPQSAKQRYRLTEKGRRIAKGSKA